MWSGSLVREMMPDLGSNLLFCCLIFPAAPLCLYTLCFSLSLIPISKTFLDHQFFSQWTLPVSSLFFIFLITCHCLSCSRLTTYLVYFPDLPVRSVLHGYSNQWSLFHLCPRREKHCLANSKAQKLYWTSIFFSGGQLVYFQLPQWSWNKPERA